MCAQGNRLYQRAHIFIADDYVIIIRLLYKVNPSERILDVTLLELSDEVIESQ